MRLMRLDEWARALRPGLDDAALRFARQGFAWICLGDKVASFDDLAARYLALVSAGQCDVLFDGFGRVAACVSFAWLDLHAEQAALRHGFIRMPAAALCGGERPWIVDFVAFNGHVTGALDALRSAILPQADSVTYFRYKHGRRIAKMVGRAELAGRLRHVGPPPDAAAVVAAYPNFAHGARGMLHMAITLGKCMTLAHAAGGFAGLGPNEVQHRLWTPISLGQYHFHDDAGGTPAGLATWALLDDDGLARQPALHALPPETWNAGTVRCVTDILAAPHRRADIEAEYAGARRYRREEAA
jgi:hemolysin-activating ACP:hemolysin acyltransferase